MLYLDLVKLHNAALPLSDVDKTPSTNSDKVVEQPSLKANWELFLIF